MSFLIVVSSCVSTKNGLPHSGTHLISVDVENKAPIVFCGGVYL